MFINKVDGGNLLLFYSKVVKLLYTVKEKGGKPYPPSLCLKKSIQIPQV